MNSLRLERRALTATDLDISVLVIYVRGALDRGAGRLESDKVVNAAPSTLIFHSSDNHPRNESSLSFSL